MPDVTVAFDERVKGWTSEFTFMPDSGLSLNNKLYTFRNGEMWEHNQEFFPRNNFYGEQGETSIEFVFNQDPTVVKNFKTLAYEGVGQWPAEIETNLEEGQVTTYVVKEGKFYNHIEGDSNKFANLDTASNAVEGIGTATVTGTTLTVERVPPFINVGDALYKVQAPGFTTAPLLFGVVSDKGDNTISFNQNSGTANPTFRDPPVTGDFIMYVKDNQSEKSGIIGFYSIVTMTNNDTTQAEIFSVNSNSFITTV